jgi:adenylate cyclase
VNRWLVGLAIGVAAAIVAALVSALPLTRTVELKTYDARLRAVATGQGASRDIVMVEIGEDAIRRLEPVVGRWPWPRLVHGALVDFLARGPARLVVYDVLFTEAAKGSFEAGETTWTGEESDQAFVDAVARAGNVILAAEASFEGLVDESNAVRVPLGGIPALAVKWPVQGFAEKRPVLTPPFPALARAARGLGHSFFALDADGPWRQFVPFVEVGDRVVPSLPVAAYLAAREVAPGQVAASLASLRLGAARVPLVEQTVPDYYGPARTVRRGLVPYRGPTLKADGTPTFTSYSFYDLFYAEQQLQAGETPHLSPEAFKDKIVFVGLTAAGLKDVFATPFGEGAMPGDEVHANVLDGLLTGRRIAPALPFQRVALFLLPALGVAIVGASVAPYWPTAVAAALVGGALTWWTTRMLGLGTWLPLVGPLVALGLAVVGDLGWKYFVEGREKRRVKRLFSRYVSRDVYQQLLANPDDAILGGHRREMSVLFSDMRGFTTLSEKGEPEDLVRQLNEYFTKMVDVVFANRGTVDKFVGDMVMALFGAPLDDPDHADHAVQTALDMVEALAALNRKWAVEGRATLDIGIGVNSGDMIAGNIGSASIMSYTVIGDNVNLGARLESLNKEYGTRVIISEATRGRLRGRYDIRPLGAVTVKGKTRPVDIFEVRGRTPSEAA